MKLEGMVAIVTGAGQGIGRMIALALAGEGADVALVGRTEAKLQAVAAEVETLGRRALPIKADVTEKAQVDQAVQRVIGRFGQIDLLVNNAGLAMVTPAMDISEEQWDRLFAINAKAPFLCSQAVGREMIRRQGGSIVNVLGLAAQIGIPRMADCCASKGALAMLTKALAVEWAKYGIRVNAVSPGWTLTPLGERMAREDASYQDRQRRIPLGRPAKPEDVANAVAYLCSPDAAYVTGQTIIVDGGQLSIHPAHV